MSKTLFIGNIESPFIKETLNSLVQSGKKLIMSVDSFQIVGKIIYDDKMISDKIQTWSWNNKDADFHIQDSIIDLFPYLYPDAIDPDALKKLLNISQYPARSYSSFRLGFGVQEELFDMFLAQHLGVNEIAYFDVLSSLQLLNPVNQLEYRKKSYEFLRFIDKENYILSKQNLILKRYKIIRPIPFFESFSEKFGHPDFINHYVIEKNDK
ncbi:MAG: hypothetical protein LBH37_03735 [Oscillospiraceae bacterium]|jgi:hypothetical protein|nr:hypothetical protein [Oscillospiraceae bacterium]